MVDIHVFLLCNNEEAIIRQTIEHYQRLGSNDITIFDNESTDKSREIAEQMNCKIIPVVTDGLMNEFVLTNLKNQCWNNISSGWCIVADMDEWLFVSNEELLSEDERGTTILSVEGHNMVSQSNSVLLTDIDLHNVRSGYPYSRESKNICFKRPDIEQMNYDYGAHNCNPSGNIRFSEKQYRLNHMAWLGLPYILDKMKRRQERAEYLKNQYGINRHYFETEEFFIQQYRENLKLSGFDAK